MTMLTMTAHGAKAKLWGVSEFAVRAVEDPSVLDISCLRSYEGVNA